MSDRIRTELEVLDERFRQCDGDAWTQRLFTGCRWAEGPAYFPAGRPQHARMGNGKMRIT